MSKLTYYQYHLKCYKLQVCEMYPINVNLPLILTSFILITYKRVLWQTVNTLMKCRIMLRHFIRAFTVSNSSATARLHISRVDCKTVTQYMGVAPYTQNAFGVYPEPKIWDYSISVLTVS